MFYQIRLHRQNNNLAEVRFLKVDKSLNPDERFTKLETYGNTFNFNKLKNSIEIELSGDKIFLRDYQTGKMVALLVNEDQLFRSFWIKSGSKVNAAAYRQNYDVIEMFTPNADYDQYQLVYDNADEYDYFQVDASGVNHDLHI